jgi:subtilase family serine protease
VSVKVDGTLPIETSEILIAGVWSEDDVYANGADNPACNGLMPTDQLSYGETMVVSFSCSGPGPAPTDQYLVVKVDVGDPEWVAESDETNNEFAFLLP